MQVFDRAPEIMTERLCLRALRVEDFDVFFAMRSDPRLAVGGVVETREEAWSRLLRARGHWAVLGFGYWALTERASGRFVGEVGFIDFRRDVQPSLDGTAEAGWMIIAERQGLGYAGEAVAAMLAWGAANIPRELATCMIAPDNAPSIAVARRAGFRSYAEATYRGEPVTLYRRRLRAASDT